MNFKEIARKNGLDFEGYVLVFTDERRFETFITVTKPGSGVFSKYSYTHKTGELTFEDAIRADEIAAMAKYLNEGGA